MAGWDTDKPIYDRLPGDNEGYRRDQQWDGYEPDLDAAYWLTKPWDTFLVETKEKIDDFYADYLDPVTAKEEYLDWLAQLAGFTGAYWDAQWPTAIKRQLILNSYSFIWPNKGTYDLFVWLFNLFTLEATVFMIGDVLADISTLPAQISHGNLRYWIVVRLIYLRTSKEWALLERLNDLFGPVFAESRVLYDQFYADFSIAGDLVFS